jgi:hypothetical protein
MACGIDRDYIRLELGVSNNFTALVVKTGKFTTHRQAMQGKHVTSWAWTDAPLRVRC